ncbi:hypothetical protein F2Q70_00021777 [Brassica cretica]|uniref:Uncharacterized protein n=1 Tax=Brassica cretica TaxID=69181 RepID=A0A8S9GJS7_BRACR|nr:hypothetical protein F2Q70_00021777 [Brassica cretica]
MANIIILTQDENGNLYDQAGHLRNATDFHVLDIELNWNSSLLLGRSFLATVGAVCDMNKNKLCLTLIDPNIHYDPIRPKRKVINYVDYGKELGFIGACHCGAEYESEYETEYSESIDTPTFPSIDSNVSMVTDDHNNTSLDDERLETHKFTNTFRTSFDAVHPTSVDTHPRPAKQPLTSIDTPKRTSIDIRAAAKIQEQENIPSLTRFTDTYINRFAPLKPLTHIRENTQANKMNTLPSTSTEKSMKSNHLKNTSSAETTLPSINVTVSTSIDTTLNPNLSISKKNNYANIDYGFLTPDEFGIFRDTDGNARAMDGRILQVSREDIVDILQVANGPDNLFSQQRDTPDVILTDPNNHAGVTTT